MKISKEASVIAIGVFFVENFVEKWKTCSKNKTKDLIFILISCSSAIVIFKLNTNMESPNFYSIITAEVMYSTDLSPFQKLLYGQITSLTQKEGYCFASNDYFAKANGKTTRAISRDISAIQRAGFIEVEVLNQNERRIFATTKMSTPHDKNVVPPRQKCPPPHDKNVHHNIKDNTKDNIKTNNSTPKEISSEFFASEIQQKQIAIILSKQSGKTMEYCFGEIQKFVSYWTELSASGRSVRWEKEKFFDLRRRLSTWFRNSRDFNKVSFASAGNHKNSDLEEYNNSKL